MGNVVRIDSGDVREAKAQVNRDKRRGITSDPRMVMLANARPIEEYDEETLANPGEYTLVVVDNSRSRWACA